MRILGGVRAQVRALVGGMALLVLAVGVAGILGVVFATGTVNRVTEELAPADAANAAILQDLTDIETSVRGWAISGEESHLQPLRQAMAVLPQHQAELSTLVADDARLQRLVAEGRAGIFNFPSPSTESTVSLGTGGGAACELPKRPARNVDAKHIS